MADQVCDIAAAEGPAGVAAFLRSRIEAFLTDAADAEFVEPTEETTEAAQEEATRDFTDVVDKARRDIVDSLDEIAQSIRRQLTELTRGRGGI